MSKPYDESGRVSKPEYAVIAGLVRPNSSILDLGCGDGELLAILQRDRKAVKVQGIEIDEQAIYKCVARGLSVFHGDIDSGLAEYGDKSFDYIILNQSFQQVKRPDQVLRESLRVGREVIVGFPNFAHYTARYQLALRGRAPITRSLPYEWYDTPNIHFLSIADFKDYCRKRGIKILKSIYLGKSRPVRFWPNLLALLGIMLITSMDNQENFNRAVA
jgi:methionine biosynthesis protein MetW